MEEIIDYEDICHKIDIQLAGMYHAIETREPRLIIMNERNSRILERKLLCLRIPTPTGSDIRYRGIKVIRSEDLNNNQIEVA